MVICLERGADLHMAQLMPLPLTVSCFSKIQFGFTFQVLAHPGSPGKRAVKRVCVCVLMLIFLGHIACAECIDAASCYRCSMVGVSLCLSVGHKRESYKNGWTGRDSIWVVDSVGPRNHALGGGPALLKGRGNFGVVTPLKMHSNSKCAENGYIDCTVYIPTDSAWPQQYTRVVRLQIHVCIYAKKQF